MGPILSGAFKPCCNASKSTVEFNLLTSENDSIHVYRTNDEIKGKIVLKPCREMVLRNVHISFEGVAEIYIWDRNMTTTQSMSPSVGKRFIRLYQPVDEPFVSEGAILKAEEAQSFQFLFVVPPASLPNVCRHPHEHPEVQRQHLHLPPSFGAGTWGEKGSLFSPGLDPETVSIVYTIKFSATEVDPISNLPIGDVKREHVINVLPSLNEMPPLLASKDSKTCQLSKRVTIRRLDRRKIGYLTVTAKQPAAIQLGQNPCQPLQPTSVILPINLEFRPAGRPLSLPVPKLIRSRLMAVTYFGVEPWNYLPDRAVPDYPHPNHYTFRQGISLPPRNLTSVSWKEQRSESTKLDVCPQDADLPAYREREDDTAVYTASISCPITLPDKVVYSPTFFSCLVSRAYWLKVDIYFDVHRKLPLTSMVSLAIPIQIASGFAS